MFQLFFIILACQRLGELLYARRNERWMKARGAEEFGQSHYPFMVMMHLLFFVSLYAEVTVWGKELSPLWPVLLLLFAVLQALRVWIILSMGYFWNTKIIVLKGSNVVSKGPFRFLKHPNYFVVTLEFIVIPLLFQAYFTLILFSIFNQVILYIRKRSEEEALKQGTNYQQIFQK
ncbi:methyltransferase [Bacillus ectoiniformans]|uniref:isoprenylcysteine carboxyl methyltransferase family protein n=1 Tax=Bacillus ectoiniformans TaxID=1494429 RepID=UPI00195EC998|nr:isoprenylcysteine carboxylmethyltransferase family protein [Bacillus ectoiniformans]MBM7647935.1 methyltransferase [Bacillus ectoiniformans]